jgi:Putative peptidase family
MAPVAGHVTIRFDNISNRETVYQRLVIIQGYIEASPNARDTLLVQPDARFEPVVWQVNHGHFKALVPLKPGANELVFKVFAGDFPHASSLSASHAPVAEQQLSTWYQRDRGSLPVQLAIVVARDSPALRPPRSGQQQVQESTRHSKLGLLTKKFQSVLQADSVHDDADRALVDAPPGEQKERLRHLEEVQQRFALQAYLWQAFHAEQMRRMGLGRRTFALDDAHSDQREGAGDISSFPKVHILISNRTVSEIRNPDNAQQYKGAKNSGAQHEFAGEVLRDPSRCPPELLQNPTAPISILTLDTMWDPQRKLLRGHAALGSADPGGRSYGVMGSHWLWAAPSSLQEVTSAFNNTQLTDTSFCVNDLGEDDLCTL